MATLEVTLFGTLRVQRPGHPVLQFPTRRVRDLFSYLLVNRHALHSREALADLFWDGAKENNPRHCLNTALWRLNRVLGEPGAGEHPFLRVDAQHIGFNTASDCRVDIAEFENRCLWAEQIGAEVPDQQATLYHQAIPFYQADLLVDCYEEWCIFERERLQRIYLRALEFLVDYHAARQEYQEATECAARLLTSDPLREDVHCKLIEFYLATSQPAAALRQYQACEATLRRELSTDPSAEMQALLPRILSRTGSPPPAASATRRGRAATARPAAAETLPAALAQLQAAVAEFDRAQAQLREAAAAVEGLASRLISAGAADEPAGFSPAVNGARSAGGADSIQIGRATVLVASATRQLVGAGSTGSH